MERTIYLNDLYDCYQVLLTDKQQKYFEDYYFQNLSLSEMSDNYGVSRNAIHHQLKLVEKKLEEYEEKLHLFEKREQILKLIHDKVDRHLEKKIEDIL